jgi:hypothetical protein
LRPVENSPGSGLGYTAYRLFVFSCNFIASRLDARQDRLEAREQRLEASLGNRLEHLERAEKANQRRVTLLEECVAILLTELRMADPLNSKLKEVASMLRDVHPVLPTDPGLQDLLRHAANAVDKESQAMSAMHQLQLWLRDTGRYQGDIDGEYGRLTRGAVSTRWRTGPTLS